MKAVEDGYECFIAFAIAMPRMTKVLPNRLTHPAFGDVLDDDVKAGVKILCLPCVVLSDELSINLQNDWEDRRHYFDGNGNSIQFSWLEWMKKIR